MKTIEEEFPPESHWITDYQLTDAYTRLRARAVEMERENRFLSWQLACAEERWEDARKLEREGALDGQDPAQVMRPRTLFPAPEIHQTKPWPT